jgi:DNA-binding MarR family transcriptional regulator
MVEYQVLAVRSDNPDRTMRMSALADITNASLSRLPRVIDRLERRGFVRRAPDRTDGRLPKATLTDEGFQALAAAAPGHVVAISDRSSSTYCRRSVATSRR